MSFQGRIKAGEVRNPRGPERIPPELALVRAFNQHEVARIITHIGKLTPKEIRAIIADENTSVIQSSVCAIWLSAKEADLKAFAILMERSVGKPREIDDSTDDSEVITVTKDNLKDLYAIARDG